MIELHYAACKRVWPYVNNIVVVFDFAAVCDPSCELVAMGWIEKTPVFYWREGWWMGFPICFEQGPAAELCFHYPLGLGCPL